MRFSFLSLFLALSACAGGEADAPKTASNAAPSGGWRLSPEGDLNSFFECLEAQGVALVSAHRGGPGEGLPENAIETFAATLQAAPALIEADVATSSDGVLFLLHDDTLDRATNGDGPTNETPWATIKTLKLSDPEGAPTPYSPPAFADALAFLKDRTILQVDFKKSTRYEDVIDEIKRHGAEDRVILIAYTMAQAERLHRLAPEMMISLNIATQTDLNRAVAAGVPAERLLGFTGVDDPKPRLFSILNSQDIEVIFGTLGGRASIDDQVQASGNDGFYADLAGMGADIIATDRPRAAQAALDADGRGVKAGICGVSRG
jgi:glycerophosphoryl diester phosphodiesterase